MISKVFIKKHKDKVHNAIKEFEHTVDNCSKETPRMALRVIDELDDAVNHYVLGLAEKDQYRKLIDIRIIQFEDNCGCNKK